MSKERIAVNIQKIRSRIEAACKRVGRDPDEVQLMLVTKTVPTEMIQYAFACGEHLIGENKAQEALSKVDVLRENEALDFHFIGHLQTNKVKDVLRFATCVQSVDRLRLANALQKRLESEDKTMNVFIQVNTSFEESKFGADPEEAIELIKEVAKLDRIHIKGLMTIGLFSDDEEKVRQGFRRLKQIQTEANSLQLSGVDVSTLSMGMSQDLEWAIEEGATMIRVGSAVFGEREYN